MKHDEMVEMRLAELLSDRPAELSELAIEIRRSMTKLAPGCSEMLYRTYAVSNVFTYTDKMGQAFIHMAVYANHVNLGFNRGTELSDPKGILQGSGKLIRHLRIDSIDDMNNPPAKSLILDAVKLGRAMAEDSCGIHDQMFIDKSG